MDIRLRCKCDLCGDEYDYLVLDMFLSEIPQTLGACERVDPPSTPCFGDKVLMWAWYDRTRDSLPVNRREFGEEKEDSIHEWTPAVQVQPMPTDVDSVEQRHSILDV